MQCAARYMAYVAASQLPCSSNTNTNANHTDVRLQVQLGPWRSLSSVLGNPYRPADSAS